MNHLVWDVSDPPEIYNIFLVPTNEDMYISHDVLQDLFPTVNFLKIPINEARISIQYNNRIYKFIYWNNFWYIFGITEMTE
jgi:hypothetical protein